MAVIPKSYQEWEQCITQACGIPLTADYVAERVNALQDERDYHTQKFAKQWGEAHRQQTLNWFLQAAAKLTA